MRLSANAFSRRVASGASRRHDRQRAALWLTALPPSLALISLKIVPVLCTWNMS